MSIKSLAYYTVICDRCGDDAFEYGDYSAWADSSFAVEKAENSDWLTVLAESGERHYCPGCTVWNDEQDCLVPMAPEVTS